MKPYLNPSAGISNPKKDELKHISNEKVNNNCYLHNFKCNCPCHKHSKNISDSHKIGEKLCKNQIRYKSTDNLLNYDYNYIDEKEKGIRNIKYNRNIYRNKKEKIMKTENNDNFIKDYVIYKNNMRPLYSTKLTKYYHDVKPKKYSYGGKVLKIATNTNNHSFKEIIERSISRDKKFNKSLVINFTNNKNNNLDYIYNYDYRNTIQQSPNYINTDINNKLKDYSKKQFYKENNAILNKDKKIKKSSSENYLSRYITNNKNTFINNDIINNDYNSNNNNYIEDNKKVKNIQHDNYSNNNYYSNYEIENKKNNNKYGIDLNNKYILNNYLSNKENENLNINNNNNNNYGYYYNYKNNLPQKLQNKRNIPKSYSFNKFKYYHSNTICNSRNDLNEDFKYEEFKLKVKLGMMKKKIYHKDKKKPNNKNYYLQDKIYLENALNNNKKKFIIEDVLLEKTKKILEEKNIRKQKKNDQKLKIKNDSKPVYSLKNNLLGGTKSNNKYIVNPRINIFNTKK